MAQDEYALFGGGCFWCVEAVFQRVKGVKEVVSGYAGGHVDNPTYRQICGGDTGHAEVARITYDPDQVDFKQLLEIFFKTHDPTTLNRQGNDVGTQYRSVVFYYNDKQRKLTEEVIQKLGAAGIFSREIVTEVSAAPTFYPAENYHQNYFNDNGGQPYCMFVIQPKLDKFFKEFGKEVQA